MILERMVSSFRWRILSPTTPKLSETNHELITLGSKYGHKTYANIFDTKYFPTMISAGVGEDVSFDLEFQALTGARVVLIDPTPSAITHFRQIQLRIEKKQASTYSQTSRQNPLNYSLEAVDFEQISYLSEALWSEVTTLPFFEPQDSSRDGSFSLNSIHNFYNKEVDSIQVQTTTISEIIAQFKLSTLDILKLDIEGAALEVLRDCFRKGVFPKQILLEVDEIHFPSLRSKLRAKNLYSLLKQSGYSPVFRDNCDFLFLRAEDHE